MKAEKAGRLERPAEDRVGLAACGWCGARALRAPHLRPAGAGLRRTHGTVAGTPDFESGTIDHSVTSPKQGGRDCENARANESRKKAAVPSRRSTSNVSVWFLMVIATLLASRATKQSSRMPHVSPRLASARLAMTGETDPLPFNRRRRNRGGGTTPGVGLAVQKTQYLHELGQNMRSRVLPNPLRSPPAR